MIIKLIEIFFVKLSYQNEQPFKFILKFDHSASFLDCF